MNKRLSSLRASPSSRALFSFAKLRLLKLIAAGAVVAVSVFGFWQLVQQPEIILEESKTSEKETIRTTLEVPGLSYEVFVPEGSTAYDLMVMAAAQYDNFFFKGKEFSGLGFFVEEINGLSQDQKEGRYWIYYINGQAAPVGVSQYKVKENDVITWKYEKEH